MRVLIIAASDSSGGAGLTRDVATLSDFGIGARCALTAVTVQTDCQLRAVHHLPPELIAAQITAALEAGDIGAIKIGALGRRASVLSVIEHLPQREYIPIVLDPVLASSSAGRLLDEDAQQLLRERLLPRVTLVTPNIPEAAALLAEPVGTDAAQLRAQALRLLQMGPEAVLVKGGHAAAGSQVIDVLAVRGSSPVQLATPWIESQCRGTGCSLASAIAAALALGAGLEAACAGAQRYVGQRLQRAA